MNNNNNSTSSNSSPSKDAGSTNEQALEGFQRHAGDRFHSLAAVDADNLLSLAWVRQVVDIVLSCEAEFKVLMPCPQPPLSKAQERIVSDFFERSVKALDLCNAIRDGIEQVRLWQKHVEIVLCALDGRQRSFGEGQFRRAKKALNDLSIAMADEKEACVLLAHRNRSFGRPSQRETTVGLHFRSLSWSVSRSWSAGRQLQAMSSNLVPPKSTETAATNGLSILSYTMNIILLFAMWALVAAIPCQDRGLQTHFSVPRNFVWAAPLLSVHERVMEESRKRDRRSSIGLLKEIHQIAVCVRHLSELADTVSFPLSEAQDEEVRKQVLQLMNLWAIVKDGLDPLEKQVRELFNRIVCSRTEALDTLSRPSSQD